MAEYRGNAGADRGYQEGALAGCCLDDDDVVDSKPCQGAARELKGIGADDGSGDGAGKDPGGRCCYRIQPLIVKN